MKQYQCHKRVHAARILAIHAMPKSGFVLDLEGGKSEHVTGSWRWNNMPMVGGYFVRYADGYTSYSPAAAFEDGYNEVVPAELQPSTLIAWPGDFALAGSVGSA